MKDAELCKKKGGHWNSKRKSCKLPFEIKWEKKYRHIVLDTEIYPNEKVPRDFMILTPNELQEINKKTKERMDEYNKLKPKDWTGY